MTGDRTEHLQMVAQERERAARVATGAEPPTAVLRGGRVVDVFTGRIRRADIALAGPRIALVGQLPEPLPSSTQVIDCEGRFVLPGFVEPHFHVGGSQLTVERLAEVLVPRGTVALGTCFYEPAFIAGPDAALDMLERASGTGLDILLSPFHAAALGMGPLGNLGKVTFDDLQELLAHPACVELREWSSHVHAIPLDGVRRLWRTALARGLAIGGHLEGLPPELVQASAALGVRSDHETASAQEAIARASSGVIVQARWGSAARDLETVLQAITEDGLDPRSFSLSTDEQELSSLLRDGHIDHKLRLAVGMGVPPVEAVRMATLNAATSLGVESEYGAVAPGRVSSLVVVDDLANFRPFIVVSRGAVSAEAGVYRLSQPGPDYGGYTGTVKVGRRLTAADFALPLADGTAAVRVIGITEGSLVTDELVEELAIREGSPVDAAGLAKIAVIDRHEGGDLGSTGLVRGLGIARGAIATTVNPGMMNLLVVGADDGDMAVAANRVVAMDGGICVACDGRVVAAVALPVLGILADAELAETGDRCLAVAAAIHEALGSEFDGLITAAGFACLAVSIPRLKICAHGLVRVSRNGQEEVTLSVNDDEER